MFGLGHCDYLSPLAAFNFRISESIAGQVSLGCLPRPPFDALASTQFWNAPKLGKSAPAQVPREARPWSTRGLLSFRDPQPEESAPLRTPESDHTPAAYSIRPFPTPAYPPIALGRVHSPLEFQECCARKASFPGRYCFVPDDYPRMQSAPVMWVLLSVYSWNSILTPEGSVTQAW